MTGESLLVTMGKDDKPDNVWSKRFVFYQRVCVPEETRAPWKRP